jgi:hypothetical protein
MFENADLIHRDTRGDAILHCSDTAASLPIIRTPHLRLDRIISVGAAQKG